MPSRNVEDKAVKLLQTNAVQLGGTARYYDIGVGTVNRVYVNESVEGIKSWNCSCKHGIAHGVANMDVDASCYHVVAALTMDAEIVKRLRAQGYDDAAKFKL